MVATPSFALKFAALSSVVALSLWTAPARAQNAGTGGTSGNGGATGGGAGAATTAGAGGSAGASSGGAGGAGGGAGAASGGTSAGGTSSSAGAPGSAGASSNLLMNGTFDTVKDPWWSNASSTSDPVAAMTVDVTNGQLCATITSGGKNPWDVVLGVSTVPLVKNQYYHIKFTMTADAPRRVKFKTGLGEAPYSDYFILPINITATATTFEYTYLNLRDDPNAQFQFQIGTYGTSPSAGTVCVDDVVLEPVPAPLTPTYKTSAPSGHPFKEYSKIVKMGTAVDTPIFLSNPAHNSIVAGEFSMITPANSMKMNLIQPKKGTFDFTDTDGLVAWAQTNGLEFRGHPLVWHTQAPAWLTSPTDGTGPDGAYTRDEMIAIMYAHIDALMTRYKGKFPYWDVVNEAIDGTDYRATFWQKTIGNDFIDLAFTRARAADPAAKLFYNDYNDEQKGNAKGDRVFELVRDLKARGIPIDGVGFQGHYFVEPDGNTATGVPDMQAIRDNMARYNEIGVEVQITECDFRIGKPLSDVKTQLQNKFFADLLQACVDAPNCSHFTVWGLSDLDSWVPSTFPDYDYAHLFDSQLKPKAAYTAMSQVFAQYNTDDSAAKPPVTTPPAAPASSGGCSLAPRTSGSAPWLLMALAMLGALSSRRRSKTTRC